jgi:hypothetical protein
MFKTRKLFERTVLYCRLKWVGDGEKRAWTLYTGNRIPATLGAITQLPAVGNEKGDPEPKERMYGSLKSLESEKKNRKVMNTSCNRTV